jgi:hypothetical protein
MLKTWAEHDEQAENLLNYRDKIERFVVSFWSAKPPEDHGPRGWKC